MLVGAMSSVACQLVHSWLHANRNTTWVDINIVQTLRERHKNTSYPRAVLSSKKTYSTDVFPGLPAPPGPSSTFVLSDACSGSGWFRTPLCDHCGVV